jgi:hypothetical protein
MIVRVTVVVALAPYGCAAAVEGPEGFASVFGMPRLEVPNCLR